MFTKTISKKTFFLIIFPIVTLSVVFIGNYFVYGWTEPSSSPPSGGIPFWNTNGTTMYYNGGNVGIGVSNTAGYKLYVSGDLAASSYQCVSDERLKTDITLIDNPLAKLNDINGVYYQWKDAAKENGRQVGVIAQNVEGVLPEIIKTNADGYKTVDYSRLSPLLIESVKELNKKNDAYAAKTEKEIKLLTEQIEKLQQRIDDLEKSNEN